MKLSKNIETNLAFFKTKFNNSDDVIYREIIVGIQHKVKLAYIMIDGLAKSADIADFVTENLIRNLSTEPMSKEFVQADYKGKLVDYILDEAIASADAKKQDDVNNMLDMIMSGDTILLIDGYTEAIIIASRGWESRSINESVTEAVIRGPRDGFTESLRMNTALVRRRIRDTRFKLQTLTVGRRSKTSVAIMYIDDIANDSLVKEVKNRIEKIDIDAIVDSSILEHLIEDDNLSPFPQVENTERPDAVASSIYEGRVAIIVDNSPSALIVPATLGTLIQSSEDHYHRWWEASFVRLIRILAILLILLPSASYIAVTAYQPGLLPTELVYYLGASRINVPFPATIEAFLMETVMEVLRQAGTRISGPIGSTIGIVGGLIIGSAAVEAGIVSNLMVIMVAITTVATFAIPSYELAAALRLWKFVLIALASFLGLYGIMIGIVLLGSHLVVLNSFGIPFSSPYSGLGIEEGDLKDTLVKAPIQRLWLRPGFTKSKDKKRMKGGKKDDESGKEDE